MIDLLAPLGLVQQTVRRGVARAVSDGIRHGVADGFDDALGLTIDVEPSELPALESPAGSATVAEKKPKTTPAKRNGRQTTRKATTAK